MIKTTIYVEPVGKARPRFAEAYIKEKGVSKFNTFDSWKPVLDAETALDAFKDIAFNPDAPRYCLFMAPPGKGNDKQRW